MSVEQIHLMILKGVNPNTLVSEYRYFGTKGFMSASTDSPANQYFEPRITNTGLYQVSMFSPGSTGGTTSTNKGFTELTNVDGGLDVLIDWGFDGGTCQILEGPENGTLADFAVIANGTIKQMEAAWDVLTSRYRDNAEFLNVPIALHYFAGTNSLPAGIEGTSDIKNKPKPRGGGSRRNITPICINTSKLDYQFNDGSSVSVGAVRDNGVELTFGSNYATSALLQAATTAAGHYDTCLAESMIQLGSSPVGVVTMDVVFSSISIGQQYKALAIEKLGSGGVVEQSIIDLDVAIPASVIWGFYTGDSVVNYNQIFDELAKAGIWWGFDNLGKLWVKQFTAPTNTNPITTLNVDNTISIERVGTTDSDNGVPIWKVTCKYNKNCTVQQTVAGSVAANLYNVEWQEAIYSSTAIKTLHPLAEELVIETPYQVYADALAEATRQFNLRSVRRDRLKVSVPFGGYTPLLYPTGGYWDDEAISETSANYDYTMAVFGNYLYIFGGFNSVKCARLDLTNPTGSWDDAGVTDLPSGIYASSCVIYGNYVYVLGGIRISDLNVMQTVIRLDLTNPTGSWDDAGVTDLPSPTYDSCSVVFGNYLYVLGGASIGQKTYRLDLTNPTGSWDDAGVTDLPQARSRHTGIVYGNYVYVIGGQWVGVDKTSVIRLDLTNPTGSWDDAGVTDLPIARSYHASVLKGNYLHVLGGSISGGWTNSVIRLDLTNPTGSWDDAGVTDLPGIRAGFKAATYQNSIYINGGFIGTALATTWRLRTNDNPQDKSQLNSLGRTINIKMPRYEYSAGRPMKIIGFESNNQNREITLDLWG